MKKLILLFLLGLLCNSLYSQQSLSFTLSREQAVADVDSLVSTITTVHPDPFTVITRTDFMSDIEDVKASLPDSIKGLDLFLRLAPLVAAIGDGHTNINATMLHYTQLEGPRFLPLELFVDPITFVMTSGGKEVLEINGIGADQIVEAVLAMESGESRAFRAISVRDWNTRVSVLYPAEEYTVLLRQGEGMETLQLDGITYDRISAIVPERKRKPFYDYRIMEDRNTAVLEFNSFNDGEKFAVFLDSMFTDINNRGIDNLIIDIRNNGGGNSILGDELFQYISPVPFTQFGKMTLRVSEPIRGKAMKEGASAEEWELMKRDTILVFDSDDSDLHALRENPLRFTAPDKNIYLLTSVASFSSATDFAWAFRYFKMGTIVGAETGGYIVCFGDTIPFYLRNSHIPGNVSWKEFYGYGATDAERHPVYPNIEVRAGEALDYVLDNLIK